MWNVSFGLSAALTTPFDEGGGCAPEIAVRHAQRCLRDGCGSVTLFGTTGEGASVAAGERTAMLEAFRAAGIDGERLVACVMANAQGDAVVQAAEILGGGAKGVLLAPPSYFKNLSEEGLLRWFCEVIQALGAEARGIILYNIPSVTAVELPVSLIGALRSAFPGAIAGVKDSSGDWSYTERLLAAHRDLAILIGDERSLAAGIRLGAQGAISGMANVLPQRLATLVRTGRDDPALGDLVRAVLRHPVTPAVKALVAHRTGDEGWIRVRAPLVPTPADARIELGTLLDGLSPAAAAA
ncbi:dihydrodipicolinate synthase family protein [Aureimonas flava]|uniref:Dihydrodipicolinate synthase family protein n=1 Tax=Aureimonas flava TaxID=2320271 RepID=A0A3A1WEB0_9HYPH|nr:dihydrodipicolinate synthase family protein [Aureimonas flava]RIX97430.1 dihydrodipicolinate synthase family protein [Aureimonas flava]